MFSLSQVCFRHQVGGETWFNALPLAVPNLSEFLEQYFSPVSSLKIFRILFLNVAKKKLMLFSSLTFSKLYDYS